MRRINAVVAMGLLGAVLAGCSDDPANACFKTGDHDTMSDGRITRICDCALKRVGALSEPDRSTLVDIIRGRSGKAGEEARYRALAARWTPALQNCEASP
jgi:hypothetical protein